MTSKEEHHLFMESLRQTLPHHSFTNSEKSLRESFFCGDEKDDAEEVFKQILEALSEFDFPDQYTAADEDNA